MDSAAFAGAAGVTVVAEPHVLRNWRTGPRWYHVVVATIEDARVVERRRDLVTAMGDLVAASTPDQAHVTLWAAGFDTAPRLPATERLTLTVAGPATFASALYLTVTAPELAEVREQLAARNAAEERTGEYVPHVTVGLYRRSVPLAEVEQRLHALEQLPALTVTANVEHLVVDTRTDRLRPAPA